MKKLLFMLTFAPLFGFGQLWTNATYAKEHNPECFQIMMEQSIKRFPTNTELQFNNINMQFNALANIVSPMRKSFPDVATGFKSIKDNLDKDQADYNNKMLGKSEMYLNSRDAINYFKTLKLLKLDWELAEYEYNNQSKSASSL